MTSGTAIRVRDLSKVFRILRKKQGALAGLRTLFSTDYDEVRAVDGVTFDVPRGEILGYLGPNGAGKSVTIKMLTGVLYPTSGTVEVDGLAPFHARRRLAGRVGVLFGQRSQLSYALPPRETFELMRRMYAVPAERYRANLQEFVDLLDLGPLMDKPVRLLSLGQRMRCELVASLLHDPEILYLDEPTIGMDVVAKESIRQFITRLNAERGITVILTTHDLADVERLCHRVMIIDHGRLIFEGTVPEIRARFGRQRRIVCALADGCRPEDLAAGAASYGEGITATLQSDGTVVVGFDPHRTSASALTKHIVNAYEVRDLTVEEADVEAIVRDIYQHGVAQ